MTAQPDTWPRLTCFTPPQKPREGWRTTPMCTRGSIDRIKQAFTLESVALRRGWGSAARRPVFVVGLARSGTTLTEQIIASHPRAHGAGELNLVQHIWNVLPEIVGLPSAGPVEALNALLPGTVRTAAQQYLDQIDAIAPRPPSASLTRTMRISSFLV